MNRKEGLTIVPLGGLCNRLRTLLSVHHLAPSLPIGVCVEWGKDKECYAFFDEIFQPLEGDNFQIARRKWYHHHNTRRNLHLPGALRLFCYNKQCDSFHPQQQGELSDFISHHKCVYLSSGYALGEYPANSINHLRLQPSIAETLKRTTDAFSPHMVGVHIRRTDHTWAIAESTDDAFVHAMEQEIQANDAVKFYLATDDESLKLSLQTRFGQRIITQAEPCRRDTLQGIKGAVVDLYALGATSKILGSFYSSFSDTAADFRGIPLVVVKR